MALTVEPLVQWVTAAPLWPEAAGAADAAAAYQAISGPTLLRFPSDSFMEEFLALLNTAPARLGERRVQPETWREPLPDPAPLDEPPAFIRRAAQLRLKIGTGQAPGPVSAPLQGTATGPLKLYQSAHQRFYMVSACLVCSIPGMPDRVLNTASQERVSFVMRRVQTTSSPQDGSAPDLSQGFSEYAFVNTARGNIWQQVTDSALAPLPGEDQLPLFPVTYVADDGRKRRLLSGLVPVGKREAYLGAPLVTSPAGAVSKPTPPPPPLGGLRETLLNMQVIQPWANLDQLEQLKNADPKNTDPKQIQSLQDQIQVASWYILLDFAQYLQKYLPKVWQAITSAMQHNGLTKQEQALVSTLEHTASSANRISLRKALHDIVAWRDKLENETQSYTDDPTNWPDFNFSLIDPNLFPLVQEMAFGIGLPPLPSSARAKSEKLVMHISQPAQAIKAASSPTSFVPTTLEKLVTAALPAQAPEANLPPPQVAQTVPDRSDSAWFVIRCVFERPNCGPLRPTVVSAPTTVFKLAAFFDPDAPARAIRISLPVDTSVAGLRKFNKNVAFVISDSLHKQMARVTDLKSAMDGKIGDGQGIDIGLICSFSIPIITICAMIVLMIFIVLLNIVFFWIPLLKICFPIPKVKE